MFNNFFDFGSPFSNPFHTNRYYGQPRSGCYRKPTRNYYDSDSTDSDTDYQ